MKSETKKSKRRRYYLHQKLKSITKVYARRKEVLVNDEILEKCDPIQKKYLNELQKLGYNLQTFIS
ncbi:hypothetical protein Oweho_3228 [Owenweeksia hongkongensis DSM 17368]|uniref:Uncharacterized protein n=1 Tax=Owenweeksia hongkongensis (strain DSM 17368 / CIP 108786 / JCM 12287 / NRRL B-23963 / UST20020801) TaxID=926562 RepID=G8R3U2_OWEHD|nr:hypothetical protein [Owenweeksia hongkongensis]AEV34179.1 hypothetical protein Oweho_3228 [Owenweeksia hongkongensis DSM 17368]